MPYKKTYKSKSKQTRFAKWTVALVCSSAALWYFPQAFPGISEAWTLTCGKHFIATSKQYRIAPFSLPNAENFRLFFQHIQTSSIDQQDTQWQKLHNWTYPDSSPQPMPLSLTYRERYANYMLPLSDSKKHRKSHVAMLVRGQVAHFQHPIPEDLVLHLRALITEVESAGMDVYFLVDRNPLLIKDDSWLRKVPLEFRRYMRDVDHETVAKAFPKSVLERDPFGKGTLVYDFWSRSHIINAWFFDQPAMRSYDFVWIVEQDIRMVGASWLQFFNHINASLPLQPATTPDFVPMNAMWRIPNSDHHGECNLEEGIVWEHKYKTLINVIGLSSRYRSQLVKQLKQGIVCWDEDHFGTLAMSRGLTTTPVSHRVYESPEHSTDTYGFFADSYNAATAFYDQWRRQATLVHPYKMPPGLGDILPGFIRGLP